MIENRIPIYEFIKKSLNNDGVLPNDFSLPENNSELKIKFAPGAKDGICIYHTSCTSDSNDIHYLKEALEFANNDNQDKAIELIREFSKDFNSYMITEIDDIQKYIIDNRDNLEANKIYNLGAECAFNGVYNEEVKFGLSILELFSENLEDVVKEAIRVLSRCDEFTIFALFIMRDWENPMQEIFETAKNVNGWGRIHAVERLEPQNEEMEQWLFEEGWKNDVINAYSALECYNKSNYFNRLKKNISIEEYNVACNLMDALLDEGPIAGITGIENKNELLNVFLDKGLRLESSDKFDIENYNTFYSILVYAQENEISDIENKVYSILKSDTCIGRITDNICNGNTKYNTLYIAKNLGIDYASYAFEAIKKDIYEDNNIIILLMQDNKYVDELIELFEEKLPLDEMATGSADEVGLDDNFKDYRLLLMIIQNLKPYTLKGINLLKTALQSPVVNNRNMAISVLEEWTKRENKPLSELVPEIYELLKNIVDKEVREDVKKRIINIIK